VIQNPAFPSPQPVLMTDEADEEEVGDEKGGR